MDQQSRTGLKIGLGLILGVVITIAVGIGVTIYAIGCTVAKVGEAVQTDTNVAMKPVTTNGELELNLTYGKDVQLLSRLAVLDENENQLWEISGGTEKPDKIVYGKTPVGTDQTFPKDGKAPADIRGKTVTIRATIRHQTLLGPGHESMDLKVEMPK